MLANLTGWHALVILAIVLLVFGSAKLPGLARSVGESMRILRDEVHTTDTAATDRTGGTDDTTADKAAQAPSRLAS
ncbi:twin-arginine translocase TatA/TatE family subunit [Ornithinicoccus hortensis]|uniref:Sec-independent protein translocase protein TatA n=1 Tax=Ornithinicoccus hortensis TaxID=82346 RepID=A0A542YLP4_9MICO|nr:twin-arginine translocase TatA/TatE family subunit [Ornithinicoccus hortensis]TQL48998.1 sec-independent protein translocase protein TatA [Ornithinicoccus hortensis]